MKKDLIIFILIGLISCLTKDDQTKRSDAYLNKKEDQIKLPISKNFIIYSKAQLEKSEYFCYKINNWIYLMNLSDKIIEDSINVLFEKEQTNKYGEISSFCFNNKDSLFLLFNRAIFFVSNKRLKKIILINEFDTAHFKTFRFANLENAPIYYDKKLEEIIGQVYCSTCPQYQSNFYKQKILGGISLETGKLDLFNITYPQKYIENYYGFANHVYTDNNDSLTLISFPCDSKLYFLNRNLNIQNSIWAQSIFQKRNAESLDTSFANSREEKMRHMVKIPYYTEVRFDNYRQLIYRFYLKELPLKNENGKYNTFINKLLILMVINRNGKVVGEYQLDKYYNNFISFVGKEGLYINYFSRNPKDSDGKVFKILTFN